MFPGDVPARGVLDEIAGLPRGDDLARLVHTLAFAAADERRASLGEGASEVAEREGLAATDTTTSLGDALHALRSESPSSSERALLAALLARGVALAPPSGAEAESRVAHALAWLAAYTPVDGLAALDAALGDKASGLWIALGGVIRDAETRATAHGGRAVAVVAAAALAESRSPAAREQAREVAAAIHDPVVRALLADPGASAPQPTTGSIRPSGPTSSVAGELVAAPRSAPLLILLGLSGYLLVAFTARWIGRLALRYREPAELVATSTGVTVKSRTELLGRTLREREVVIPIDALRSATREVRYPRAGMYAGLFALAMGSYFGIKNLIDGLRTVSFEIAGMGALFLGGGVLLDFLLEAAQSSAVGKCRVVLVPRKGPAVALGSVERAAADAALAQLAR